MDVDTWSNLLGKCGGRWMLPSLQKSVQLVRICSPWIFYENI